MRSLVAALVTGLALPLIPLATGTSAPPDVFQSFTDDDNKSLNVTAEGSAAGSEGSHHSSLPATKYLRADAALCAVADLDTLVEVVAEMGSCAPDQIQSVIAAPCPPGTFELAPLWVQHLQPDGTYGPPEKVTDLQCVTPADLAAQAEQVFATMHVPASPATLQTSNPTLLLVNTLYPVYTSDQPVTQEATLLDVPVEVQAVPARFRWDFDDPFSDGGSTLTTSDPGTAWVEGSDLPDDTWVAHAWTALGDPDTARGRSAGSAWSADGVRYRTDVTVSLTTTWQGQFRIAGTAAWTDIPGTITTTSTAGTFTVTEARTRLFCDDLAGNAYC